MSIAASPSPSIPRRLRKIAGLEENTVGYLLIMPTLGVLALLIFLPLLSVVWDSLHNKTFLSTSYKFIGLDNYRALFASPGIWAIVIRSLIWTLFSVVLQVNVGLVMALFLNQVFLGRAFFRVYSCYHGSSPWLWSR